MVSGKKIDNQTYQVDLVHLFQLRLKLIARIALSISLLSGVILLFLLYFLLRGHDEASYLDVFQSLTRAREKLDVAIFLGGALILLVAGLINWMITLYSSARVSGPLHRFSKNIELEINQGPTATVDLRQGDYFQALSKQLGDAAKRLKQFYYQQRLQIDELERYIDTAEVVESNTYSELIKKLKTSAAK